MANTLTPTFLMAAWLKRAWHGCWLLGCWLLLATPAMAADTPSILEFTKPFERHPGLFTFFYDKNGDKVYLQVPSDRGQFLLQTSLPYGLGSNDIGLDRGQLGKTAVVSFARFGNKLLLTEHNLKYRASSSNAAEQASVNEAFADSVLFGFPIVAQDSSAALVDYTPFLQSDIHQVGARLADGNQGRFSVEGSRSAVFMARSKSFVSNTELEAVVTFVGEGKGEFVQQVASDSNALTLHLHHSLVALPDDDYQPRVFHPNSGYWAVSHVDYSAPLSADMTVRYIPRHRLAKKHPEQAVSEPVAPIVYYLDPGVPEPVRSALLDGASWWAEAFAAAGYQDAFVVKLLPEHVDPMDIRYNVIQWVHRATRGWSYGSSVIDPRTGEIIKGLVTLGSLRVRQDIRIAAGLVAPYQQQTESQAAQAVEAMALDRIRQLAAHEVGHTLGIAHNFAASTQQRSSVMDYPHPLLDVSEQGIGLAQAYEHGIGAWDKWVVQYGYQDFRQDGHYDARQEQQALQSLLATAAKQGMRFISDEDARPQSGGHPYGHLWDNGEDPSSELNRIWQARHYALNHFSPANLPFGRPLSELADVLVPVYLLHRYQVEATAKLIAGIDYRHQLREERNQPWQRVNAATQRQALTAVLQTLNSEQLTLPSTVQQWLQPADYGSYRSRESIVGRQGLYLDSLALAEVSVQHSLALLLNPERLNRLQQQAAADSEQLSVDELLNSVVAQTLTAPVQAGEAELVQQNTNYQVLRALALLSQNPKLSPTTQAQIWHALTRVKTELAGPVQWPAAWQGRQRFNHYLLDALAQFEQKGQWPAQFSPLPMPPGSPI